MKRILIYKFLIIIILSFIILLFKTENLVCQNENKLLKQEVDFYKNELIYNKCSNISNDYEKNKIIELYSLKPQYTYLFDKMLKFDNLNLLIELSSSYGYDWLFFVSLIQAESNFDASAISKTNAQGLMQITKWVYANDTDPLNEIHNIFVGISYYDFLYNKFSNSGKYSKKDLEKFTLASYNFGYSKIKELQKQAELEGKNKYKFSNIEDKLPSDVTYYVNKITKLYYNLIT
jgi:membrane-bound lytic murein transglycosylase MltF